MTRLFVKICGITSLEDAELAADLGADAIGLNFVAGSPRRVELARARAIADVVRGRVEIVGVVADLDDDALLALASAGWLDALQLHGDEPVDRVELLAFGAAVPVYKAVRLGDGSDIEHALAYPGRLLVDAKVEGALGGTGKQADWSLAAELAASRPILLAGGLTPDNVAEAVARVRPFGVDLCSGVRTDARLDAVELATFVSAFSAANRGLCDE